MQWQSELPDSVGLSLGAPDALAYMYVPAVSLSKGPRNAESSETPQESSGITSPAEWNREPTNGPDRVTAFTGKSGTRYRKLPPLGNGAKKRMYASGMRG